MEPFEIAVHDDRVFVCLGESYLMASIAGGERFADGATVHGVKATTGEQFWTDAAGQVMAVDVVSVSGDRGQAQAWKVFGRLPNH